VLTQLGHRWPIGGAPLQVDITVYPSSLTVFTQAGTGMGIRA
jgi:hypothetical protein